jgi:phosphatidylglycerophosphate synthase
VEDRALPAWAAVTIISREFLITGLRLLAASRGIVLAADNAGKHKTAWQIVTVIYFLLLLSVREIAWPTAGAETAAGLPHVLAWPEWYSIAWNWGGTILIGLALALTLYSGLMYLWKNRELISGM